MGRKESLHPRCRTEQEQQKHNINPAGQTRAQSVKHKKLKLQYWMNHHHHHYLHSTTSHPRPMYSFVWQQGNINCDIFGQLCSWGTIVVSEEIRETNIPSDGAAEKREELKEPTMFNTALHPLTH